MSNLSLDTWRAKVGLASWDFQLGASHHIQKKCYQVALRDHVISFLEILPPFATVYSIFITTKSEGEDVEEVKSGEISKLKGVLEKYHDIEQIEVCLNLNCFGVNGMEECLIDSSTLWFQLEDETDRESPLRLLFSLDVDLFFPKTRGEISENPLMSKLNYARLNDFLERIKTQASGELMEIDAPSYRNYIDDNGHIVMG